MSLCMVPGDMYRYKYVYVHVCGMLGGVGAVGSTSGAPGHGRILTSKLAFSDPVAKVMAWNARSHTAVGPREVGACDEETAGRWRGDGGETVGRGWGDGGEMAGRWRGWQGNGGEMAERW